MLTALRSEPIAEAQELRLIDRRQNCRHRSLDDLVPYGSDAERSLSAIRLRYILPARRQRSIRPCVDASMQVQEVRLQAPVLRLLMLPLRSVVLVCAYCLNIVG